MSFSEVIAPLLGRIAIGWYLITQAWGYAVDWNATVDMLEARHIAAPPVLFGLFLAVVALTAIALIIGYQTRYAAMVLFAADAGHRDPAAQLLGYAAAMRAKPRSICSRATCS